MSRAPPFPTNAGTPSRPPTNVNGNGLPRDVRSASTRPLQIGRPTRPTSPNDTGYVPNGPTRPTRSDLRPSGQVSVEYPISEASSSRGPNYARDGQDAGAYGEMRYEAGSPPRQRAQNANMTPTRPAVRRDRSGTMNTMSSGSVNGADEPSSLGGVLSAFQSAGVRARVANATDPEWDRQREREIEEEQARQQRIRDRVPGRKVNGKQRTLGDIDGKHT
jgi:exocyst complex component 4